MADQKISELDELAQGDIATADEVAVNDDSATQTKRFTWSSLRGAIATYLASLTQTLTNKTFGDDLDMGSNKITNVTDPTAAQDAATKNYVDTGDRVKAASYLLALAQDTPDLTLKVLAGKAYFGGDLVDFSQTNTSSFSVPVTDDRIDILSLNSAGSLVITEGTEAVSPTAPDVPHGNIPIAQVYMRAGATSIKDTDDSTNGYVQKDLRPFLQEDSGWKKIAEITAGGSSAELDATGLDLDTHKAYRIVAYIHVGVGEDINLFMNDDETATNYYTQLLTASDTTVAGARSNNATLKTSSGTSVVIEGIIARTPSSGLVKGNLTINGKAASDISLSLAMWVHNADANLTSLNIKASANYTSGSKLLVFAAV